MSFSEWSNNKKKKKEESSRSTASVTSSENTSSSSVGSAGLSFTEWSNQKKAPKSAQDWVKSSGDLLSEVQQFYSNWNNDKLQYNRFQDKASTLLAQADSWRKQYAGNDEAVSQIDSVVSALTDIKHKVTDYSELYTQFESAEEYKKALQEYQKQQKEYNDLLNLDADGFDKEIEVYRSAREEMRSLMESISEMKDIKNQGKYTEADIASADARYKELEQKYGYWDEIDDVISEKERYLKNAQRIQEGVRLSSVSDPTSEWYDPNFNSLTGYVSTESDGVWAELTSKYGMGYDDLTYEYINGAENGMRKEIRSAYRNFSQTRLFDDGESIYEENGYDYMTEDEISIYNYYYAKDGKEAAEKYLDSILETLRYRKATEDFKPLEGNAALELLFGVEAGLDQFESGVKNLVNTKDDYIPATSTQMLSGMVREDLSDVDLKWYNAKDGQLEDAKIFGNSLGQMGYDAITTTANMAPSILTSVALSYVNPTLGQVAGNALLGASASGNAYQEKLNLGYTQEEARTYGLAVGASEAVLQYALGGIGALGKGTLSKTVLKNLDAVDNVFARFAKSGAGKILLSAGSEAVEEGLQSVIEPFLWNAVSGEEISIDWQESLYNALLGFATGGMFEAGGTAINSASTNAVAKAQYGESQQELVGEALEIDPGNAFAHKMQSRLDNGKNLSGGQLNRLVQQNEATLTAQDMAAIQSAAESRLAELGETGNVKSIAAALTKQAAGQKLSQSERQAISSSQYAQRVANELNTENIRSGEYSSSWAEKIDTQRINVDEYSRLVEAAQQPQEISKDAGGKDVADAPKAAQTVQTAAVEAPAANDQHITGKLTGKESLQVAEEASATEDGKTYQIPNAKQVTPKKVTSITTKDAMIQLESGEEVSVKNIAFGTESENLLWRTTLQISNMTPAAANTIILEAKDRKDSIESYIKGAAAVFQSGYNNMEINPEYGTKLTTEQRDIIYKAGRQAAEENVAKEQARIEAANKKTATENTSATVKKGGVYYGYEGQTISERVSSGKNLNAKQSVGVEFAERLAKSRGITFYFYESYVNENGDRVYKDKNGDIVKAENGFYDPSDGSIHIDLNAGYDGKGTVLFTISHELVHFINDWSPRYFKKLADILMQGYRQKDVPVDTLVKMQQANALERGRELSYDEAYEEVIADSMETILADGKVMELMQDIEKADKSLGQKIKEFFQDIVQLLKDTINAYRSVDPDTVEGTLVSQMDDLIAELQQAFAEGIYEAGENYQSAEKKTSSNISVKMMARENKSIPYILYCKLLNKRSIATTKKDWAKVSDARIDEYRGMSEEDILDIDFLEIAEYKEINVGYVYTIRNYGADSFEIIGKKRIRNRYDGYVMEVSNNGETGQRDSIRDAEKGSDNKRYTDSNRLSGYQGTLRKNAGRSKESQKSEPIDDSEPSATYNGQRTVSELKFSARKKLNASVTEMLQQENEKLKEDVQHLKDLLKLQRTVTGGTKFTKTSVEAAARMLKNGANARGDTAELAKLLNSFYEGIATEKELSWESVRELAKTAVEWLQSHTEVKPERSEYANDILSHLRTSRIYLNDVQMKEAAYRYGSYDAYRKMTMGSIILAKEGSVSLDTKWQELSAMYPDVFDADMSSSDMPEALVEAIGRLRNSDTSVLEYEYSKDLIAQDLLRKLYDSYWRASTLRTFADSKQREINRLKSQHYQRMDKLRADNAVQIEQMKADHRAAVERINSRHRQQMEKQHKAFQQQYRESKKKAVESREKTAMRQKIRKVIRDLDKILNRGNKKRNVKEEMRGFVSKALELADYLFTDHISNDDLIRKGIDADLIRGEKEASLVKETKEILDQLYDSADSLTDEEFTMLDAKRKRNIEKLNELLTQQRNRRLNTPVYNLFNDLVTEYAGFKNSKQDAVKAAYDPKVEEFLRSYIGEVNGETDSDRKTLLQNMRVADMTMDELWRLHNAYTMVLHSIRVANKFFAKNMNESIEQCAKRIASDFGSRKIPDKKLAIAFQKVSNKIGWDYEKLYYAMDRIGSEVFTELIMNLADSENTVMQDIIEAAEFRDQIVKKYGFNKWTVNKELDREFIDSTGKKFKLTLGQMMSLYAYSRRDGAWDHIEYGGFVFGKAALTNPKPADSYKLSKEQCEAITNTLTKEQKGYVEDMQKFLSETMGAKGNEISMQLYGIEMFHEKNYFPIHIAGQFKAQAQEAQAKAAAGFGSMSNAGFTHAQNPNAKAPFVLEGFNEVWADHVNEMSRYHGTVPALEDIRRVMNCSSYFDSAAESISIKQIMENSFGKDAVDYFDNLYREANSGAITDKMQGFSKKLLSMFRKNSVAYSLSVLIQQPASIVRAYALIDKKYFGFKGFGALPAGVAKAITSKWIHTYNDTYAEMLKYAPGVTMAKEIGGFDTASGSSIRSYLMDTGKSLKQKWATGTAIEKGKAVLDVVDDNAIANLPNVADKIAWIEIWNACKRETLAKNTNLSPTSEEFMQKVSQRFTDVIRATQVYDSIFAKSPMLKSKNLAVQYLVSFMNEPNTVANMVESSVRDLTKGDVKKAVKTVTVVVRSIVFTGVLKSIIYAMRDDDEDETFTEKYLAALTGSLIDDMTVFNYIPFARDIWSLAQGYDVERADMAIVADALDAVRRVVKNATTETEDMTEEELIEFDKKVTEANWKLVESVAAFFGIPAKNIRREIDAVIDHARIAYQNSGKTTWLSLRDAIEESIADASPTFAKPDTKSAVDKLYHAIVSGDITYIERLSGNYETKEALDSAIRKGLRGNDSRIWEAAIAWNNNELEEYMRIAKKIKGEKHFSQDNIVAAIQAEAKAMQNTESDNTESKAKGYFTVEKFVVAISQGNDSMATIIKADIIETAQKNGKTVEEAEDSFKSSAKSRLKEMFIEGGVTASQAIDALTKYCGVEEENAQEDILYWDFITEYPEYSDLSEAAVTKYYEYAAPAGIGADVYYEARKFTSAIEGDGSYGSVKNQYVQYILSLDLTPAQQNTMWHALKNSSWSEKDTPFY